MKIKSLHIKNFKSIVDLAINEPNPFTVFVGPNGSGKSNIFEALEFWSKLILWNRVDAVSLFGGISALKNRALSFNNFHFQLSSDKITHYSFGGDYKDEGDESPILGISVLGNSEENIEVENFWQLFSRIFIRNKEKQKINYQDNFKLSFSCDNLEKVLKRLLEKKEKREEISEWLDLFIPEFDRIEVQKSEFSSNENLLIYQKHYDKPFNKELISDGTYNIISLLTAVYQSDEPQFLCIEEPENGLHPFVQRELVNFLRWACEEYGHYIWLNTHSQTIVSQLKKEEIITVRKNKGETEIQQHKDTELYDLPLDEAWMNKFLEGGVQWG